MTCYIGYILYPRIITIIILTTKTTTTMKTQRLSLGSSGQAIVITENVYNEFGLARETKTGILNIDKNKAELALEYAAKHAWDIQRPINGQQFGAVKMLRPLTEEELASQQVGQGARGNVSISIEFDETLEAEDAVTDEVVQSASAQRTNA
jgi:hypothetical protein